MNSDGSRGRNRGIQGERAGCEGFGSRALRGEGGGRGVGEGGMIQVAGQVGHEELKFGRVNLQNQWGMQTSDRGRWR